MSLLAGCGRIAFEDVSSGGIDGAGGVLGHDEDGDQIADVDDVCPFVTDPLQADADGDRVGDVCDPQPTQPTQRIAVFAPMTPDDPVGPTITADSSWTRGDDAWRTTGTPFSALRFGTSIGEGYIEAGFQVIQHLSESKQVGIAIGGLSGEPHYYVEVYDDTAVTPFVGVSTYTGSSYNLVTGDLIDVAEFAGIIRLRLNTSVGAATMTLQASLNGTAHPLINASTPGSVSAPFRVIVQDSIIDVLYVAAVTSEP